MNIYGYISAFFIKNKKLSLLLFLGCLFWGFVSFIVMPKQYNPDIVAPAFAINVEFPNSTVDEVYHLVTQPLEDVLNEIRGIENIYSKSVHGGRASVIVEFYVGEDLEDSMITLRQRIASRLELAPLGVGEPSITSIDPEDLPIKTLALFSNSLNPTILRRRAFQLKQEIKQIEGVSIVEVIGGRHREFTILLDPQKMQESKTSLTEIQEVLGNTSLLKDLGLIKTQTRYMHIETQEQATTVKDIEEIVIISNIERDLKIKDVADVIEGPQERESFVHFTKKGSSFEGAVFMAVAKQKGKNIIDVSRRIDRRLAELNERRAYLDEVQIEVVKDEGRVAREEIEGLVRNLLQAIGIVFLILLCFLNYRAAFIVALSIPITLLTVLALGNLFGYTINRITLFALILSLGLLVDSATVVIENIVRNKKEDPRAAKEILIPKAVAEVGGGLFLSTLTTVLAFIPMLFVTGMMGPYMGPIPFFVSAALIISLIFAYTLNPWLAYMFCKEQVSSHIEQSCGIVCRVLEKSVLMYQNVLSCLLVNRRARVIFLLGCLGILVIVGSFPVLKWLRFRMLPKADREQVFIYIDLDRGTSVEQSNKIALEAGNLLEKEKHIKSIQSFVGVPPVLDFNGLFRGVSGRSASHQITLKLNLTHPKKRSIPSEELAFRYREVLSKHFKMNQQVKFTVVEDPPGPPVRATFYLKVKARNPELLSAVSKDLEQRVKGIKGVKDIDISSLEQNDKFVLFVNKEAAARSKVSVESISKELETIFTGRIIGVYHSNYNLEQEYIVLRLNRALRDQIEDLDKILISNEFGNHIPLSRFIQVQKTDEQDVITNDNRERVITISGEMGKRSVTYAAIDLLGLLQDYKVPQRSSELVKFNLLSAEYLVNGSDEVKVEIGGEWDLTVKVFRDLGLAMLVAIILIYLVLVAQFKSFSVPILILGTIPLALIGVIPGFAILFVTMRVYFSATSMIGVIALAGIVVNNAIIFMEYIKQVSNQCASLKEALLKAGLTRMRPILLTSITTILGSLVIASDPVWSGLAWSIVFGLSLSSVLTLVVFPSLIYEFLGEKWYKTN